MRGAIIVLLVLLTALPFAEAKNMADLEARSRLEGCIPRATPENPLVLEEMCEKRLNADCRCKPTDTAFLCNAHFNTPPRITCAEGVCTLNFLGKKETTRIPAVNVDLLESFCKSMANANCMCAERAGAPQCDIIDATIKVSCNEEGCIFTAGKYSKELKFCDERSETRINIERSNGNVDVHIEGTVVGEKDGMRALEDGVISVSGELSSGVGVDIVANLETMLIDSDVRAQRVEIQQEIKEKFRAAVRSKYNTENFNMLDAIEVNLTQLKDGKNIKSATIRFRIPKSMVDGEVVVFRYGDDGTVDVLTPTVSEEDNYYIYRVETNGLSLYAVATVNQISKPLSQGTATDSNEVGKNVCGTIAVILAILGGLYMVREST